MQKRRNTKRATNIKECTLISNHEIDIFCADCDRWRCHQCLDEGVQKHLVATSNKRRRSVLSSADRSLIMMLTAKSASFPLLSPLQQCPRIFPALLMRRIGGYFGGGIKAASPFCPHKLINPAELFLCGNTWILNKWADFFGNFRLLSFWVYQ